MVLMIRISAMINQGLHVAAGSSDSIFESKNPCSDQNQAHIEPSLRTCKLDLNHVDIRLCYCLDDRQTIAGDSATNTEYIMVGVVNMTRMA
jgi:hypothetical protein